MKDYGECLARVANTSLGECREACGSPCSVRQHRLTLLSQAPLAGQEAGIGSRLHIAYGSPGFQASFFLVFSTFYAITAPPSSRGRGW